MIIQAKQYKNRQDLELFVKNNYGLTPDLKTDITIKGKRDELEILQLSDRRLFYGIKCEISDKPTKIKEITKVNRKK